MRKLNKKELRQKNMEKYYSQIYSLKVLGKNPVFLKTDIHPDCLIKCDNKIYAVEATGYFYQQETDYSNRLSKKILRLINKRHFLYNIYLSIGKKPLLNIIDAIYYNKRDDLINDLLIDKKYIEEIKINNNYFYNNEELIYNALFNDKIIKTNLEQFLSQNQIENDELKIEVTLKQKNIVPIKVIMIYNSSILYDKKRTLVPIVSFKINNAYNFQSLRSLILNKEKKLNNIYISELKRQNILYDEFILLIHPIDYPIDIYPELIYNKLKDIFKASNFSKIAIILKDCIMVIERNHYVLY